MVEEVSRELSISKHRTLVWNSLPSQCRLYEEQEQRWVFSLLDYEDLHLTTKQSFSDLPVARLRHARESDERPRKISLLQVTAADIYQVTNKTENLNITVISFKNSNKHYMLT